MELERLKAAQSAEVARIEAAIVEAILTGDEYEEHILKGELVVASSLARLVHKAKK